MVNGTSEGKWDCGSPHHPPNKEHTRNKKEAATTSSLGRIPGMEMAPPDETGGLDTKKSFGKLLTGLSSMEEFDEAIKMRVQAGGGTEWDWVPYV